MNDMQVRSEAEARWARAVRVLALLSALLLIIAFLEGWTLRRARADLQRLRTERSRSTTSPAAWGQAPDPGRVRPR